MDAGAKFAIRARSAIRCWYRCWYAEASERGASNAAISTQLARRVKLRPCSASRSGCVTRRALDDVGLVHAPPLVEPGDLVATVDAVYRVEVVLAVSPEASCVSALGVVVDDE